MLTGCFTGVEGTRRIELSKSDRELLQPSAEETFMADLKGYPYKEWIPGKRFHVTDDRAALAFNQKGLPSDPTQLHLGGKTLTFTGVNTTTGLNGEIIPTLTFSLDSESYQYPLRGRQTADSLRSDQLPMMVDSDMLILLNSKLKGKNLWTRTSLWYDEDGNDYRGGKFIPVTVTDVTPGSGVYPFRINFTNESGNNYHLYMGTRGSRKFSSLFSLSDPYLQHPQTEPHIWELICHEKVTPGMTKQECLLSLGNPDEADAGHSHSYTLDLWKYSNGTTLFFEDGILKEYR